jgi:hypothetical protein
LRRKVEREDRCAGVFRVDHFCLTITSLRTEALTGGPYELPPASEGGPEDNDQHLLAISDVDAIADIALAPEFGRC